MEGYNKRQEESDKKKGPVWVWDRISHRVSDCGLSGPQFSPLEHGTSSLIEPTPLGFCED